MRKSKWIEVRSPQEPVETVARRALDVRLRLVWHYLHLAATKADEDVEHVHQLRVSTRRAVATMETFSNLLPPKRALWMEKQLKRVRQAAGDARDLDVLLDRLRKLAESESITTFEPLLESLERERRNAQEPIEQVYKKLDRKNFPRRKRGLIKRARLRTKVDKLSRPTFECAARKALRPLVDDFFIAAAADFTDYHALHAFRIQGKQLRYAMEIFAGAFDKRFQERLYPIVESLQEKLGEINDHAAAKARFEPQLAETCDPELREALVAICAHESQAIENSRAKFLAWWTADRSRDLRRRFDNILSLEACLPGNEHELAASPEPHAQKSAAPPGDGHTSSPAVQKSTAPKGAS